MFSTVIATSTRLRRSPRRHALNGLAALLVLLSSAPQMMTATDYTWGINGGGAWTTATNWSPNTAFPNAATDTATFGNISVSSATITTGTPLTINQVTFNESSSTYTLSPSGGALTFDGATPQLRNINNGTVNVSGGTIVLATDTIFNVANSNRRMFVSSAISGAGGMEKTGAGSLWFEGAKTYLGDTTISGGTLYLGYMTYAPLTGTPEYHPSSLSSAAAIINNGVLRISGGGSMVQGTHFGAISGSGQVIADQADVTLSGNNTYTGKTTIAPSTAVFGVGATLRFDSIQNVGGGPSALGAPTTVADGTIDLGIENSDKAASLIYTGTGHTTDRVLNLASEGGTITLRHSGSGLLKFTSNLRATVNGTKAFTLTADSGRIGELAGSIRNYSGTDTTSVTKNGTGTWILSGDNTYTGSTSVSQGTLQIGSGGTTGSLSPSSNLSIFSSGTLAFNRSDTVTQGTHFDASISGSGHIRQNGTGTLVFNGVNTNTGTITVAAGTMQFGQQTALFNNTPASWTAAKIIVESGAMLALNVGGTGEFTTGDVTTLLGNLTTAITNNGLRAGSSIAFDTTNAAGGTFTVADNITDSTGTGAGALGVTKLGSGDLVLSGNSSYTGATTVNGGILQVNANNALGAAAAGTTVAEGAALRLNGVSYTTAEALAINGTGISGGGALVNAGTSSYAGQITAATNATINAGGGTLTVTGGLVKNGTTLTIAGGGSVIVNGTGISGASANSDLVVDGTTLVVNANSNYNGPTTVQNSGTLVANAQIDTTTVTVTADSTLSGTGKVVSETNNYIYLNGALIVGDSTLGSPVASQFELHTSGTGSTVLGTSSFLAFDLFTGAGLGDSTALASAADRLRLFGNLDATLGGTLVLGNPNAMTGFAAGDMWKLIDLQGGANLSGTLALDYSALILDPTLGGTLDHSTGVFSIVYVPEPSRGLLMLAGLSRLLVCRRRRL